MVAMVSIGLVFYMLVQCLLMLESFTVARNFWIFGLKKCPTSWNLLLDCDTIYPLFPHAFMEIEEKKSIVENKDQPKPKT
jgi:hypothetical protein